MSLMEVFNYTQFNETLDFDAIWNSTFDNYTDVNQAIDALELNHVLWETYAFYELLFEEGAPVYNY